jgi:PKD repeat protein
MTKHTFATIAIRGLLALAVAGAAGCSVSKQSTPAASGPSTLALSISLLATPDRLVQDGASQSTITAVAFGPSGNRLANVPLQWGVSASDGRQIEPSSRFSTTDANGVATVVVTAPPAPSAVPTTPLTLTVTATPLGTDSDSSFDHRVTLELVSPPGTPLKNNDPVALFTVSPLNATLQQSISFDASTTTDEGQVCGTACTYSWDYGDSSVGTGITSSHAYAAGGTFTVTLTVTDARNGRGTATRTVTITAPAAPVAVANVSPSNAQVAGTTLSFSGAGSTVGSGAQIVEYTWIWGDATPNTVSASPQATHAYAANGTYVVRLTVKDSFGRTATTTTPVTVGVAAP